LRRSRRRTDLAADDLAGRDVDQAHDRVGGDALAAAGLADQADRAAAGIEKSTPSTALTVPSMTWK
jgi:hypothetical protein